MVQFLKFFLKSILMFAGIFSFSKCTKAHKDTGKRTFHGMVVTDKNFIVLNDDFAKDSAVVYYKSHVIPSADPASFVTLNDHYAKDKNHIYYCDEYRQSETYFTTKKQIINVVDNADVSSFVAIDDTYAKDKNAAYIFGNAFDVSDPSSFTVLDRYFSKDNKNIYYNAKLIPQIDGKSFEIINANYAKDANFYFMYGFPSDVISYPEVITKNNGLLEILEYPFSKTSTAVFYKTIKIHGISPEQAIVITNGYIKDNHHVYHENNVISGSDPGSFVINEQNLAFGDSEFYTWDKHAVYYGNEVVKNANPNNVSILGLDYIADADHVFYKTHQVKEADRNTFKVFDHGHGDEDAQDKNNKYLKGIKVP